MDTNRLRHFRTLVETGNMRKAAEMLHISHGGLSKSIKKLEEELGVQLTRPDGRGIAVTEEGRRVYQHGLELLKATQGFLTSVKTEMKGSIPHAVRIGTFEVFSTYFMGAMLERDKAFPPVRLREYIPGKLEEALHTNEIDVGITYLPIPRPDISFLKVRSIEMGIFTVEGTFPKVAIEDLPFVVPVQPVEGSPTGVKGLDGWPDHLFPRNVRYEVELMETGLAMARQGLCAIFIPHFIARLHNDTVAKKFQLLERSYPSGVKTVARDVYLLTKKDGENDRIVKKIAAALRTFV